MKKYITILLFSIVIFSCSKNTSNIPLDKPYWTPSDYFTVIRKLKYEDEYQEALPAFDDPQTAAIIHKLADHNNYLVVVNDDQLGLKYKNEVASKFFEQYRNMTSLYTRRDVQDKYIYEMEMLAVYDYGLELQLHYFDLGNKEIAADADNPEDSNVKNVMNSNVLTLINNYNNILDYVNEESSFTNEGVKKLNEVIDMRFNALIDKFPEANYYTLENKLVSLKDKAQSTELKTTLSNLLEKINSNKKEA